MDVTAKEKALLEVLDNNAWVPVRTLPLPADEAAATIRSLVEKQLAEHDTGRDAVRITAKGLAVVRPI